MVNSLPTIRLAQSILKCKFPFEYKPLKKGFSFGILRYDTLCPLAYRIDISLQIFLYDKQLKSKRLNGWTHFKIPQWQIAIYMSKHNPNAKKAVSALMNIRNIVEITIQSKS